MVKKIGIPRALIYYKFYPLWLTFFENVGAKVVLSPKTNKHIQELAVKYAPDEDCYSTKLYYGHVMALKNKVDYLFIPRFGSNHPTNVGCPKFIGLAESLRSMYPDLPEILMPYYSEAKAHHTKFDLIRIGFELGFKFTKNPLKIARAIRLAVIAYREHLEKTILKEEEFQLWEQTIHHTDPEPKPGNLGRQLKVALVGHPYLLNDEYASISIRKKLEEYDLDVITSEQVPRTLIEKQMNKLDSNMFFEFERELLGTVMHFLENKTVDGIIHLIVFSCGPDSINGEMASRYSRRMPEIPLLQLVLDEHTGEAGLNTRLEAFIDLIKRRHKKYHSLSPTLVL